MHRAKSVPGLRPGSMGMVVTPPSGRESRAGQTGRSSPQGVLSGRPRPCATQQQRYVQRLRPGARREPLERIAAAPITTASNHRPVQQSPAVLLGRYATQNPEQRLFAGDTAPLPPAIRDPRRPAAQTGACGNAAEDAGPRKAFGDQADRRGLRQRRPGEHLTSDHPRSSAPGKSQGQSGSRQPPRTTAASQLHAENARGADITFGLRFHTV